MSTFAMASRGDISSSSGKVTEASISLDTLLKGFRELHSNILQVDEGGATQPFSVNQLMAQHNKFYQEAGIKLEYDSAGEISDGTITQVVRPAWDHMMSFRRIAGPQLLVHVHSQHHYQLFLDAEDEQGNRVWEYQPNTIAFKADSNIAPEFLRGAPNVVDDSTVMNEISEPLQMEIAVEKITPSMFNTGYKTGNDIIRLFEAGSATELPVNEWMAPQFPAFTEHESKTFRQNLSNFLKEYIYLQLYSSVNHAALPRTESVKKSAWRSLVASWRGHVIDQIEGVILEGVYKSRCYPYSIDYLSIAKKLCETKALSE